MPIKRWSPLLLFTSSVRCPISNLLRCTIVFPVRVTHPMYRLLICVLFLGGIAAAQAVPVLFYSDLPGGMCTGGKGGNGHIVTVRGNNFGAAHDASHYVTIAGKPAAAYLLWQDDEIAFQPGCSVPDGDYTITVTTPAGTSNQLPFHIYSGSAIYFADQSTGSDRGPGSYTQPYKSLTKCRQVAAARPGNTCYLMPGFIQTGFDAGSCYMCISRVQGTEDKYVGILGYPTNNLAEMAQIGNVGLTPDPMISVTASKYVVVGNLKVIGVGGYEAIRLGMHGDYAVHHIRIINMDQTLRAKAAIMALQTVYASHIQVYGLSSHDINNSTSSKHVGHVYIGDGSHDIDFGWSTLDGSCAYKYPTPCLSGKQFEVHPTAIRDPIPPPAPPALNVAGGGKLAAGTYEVKVTYRAEKYSGTGVAMNGTETTPSPPRVIVLSGGGDQNALTVAHPPGYQRPRTRDDGDTVICNPTLAYKIYACRRGDPATPCTAAQFEYQGEVAYNNVRVYDGITAADFMLSALQSGAAPPSTNTTTISGCEIYNVAVHDSQFIDPPDYAWALSNFDAVAPRYMRFYNNVVMNAGNNANMAYRGAFVPVCFNLVAYDFQGTSSPHGGTLQVFNNTFYNCGSLTTMWHSGIFGYSWNESFPPLAVELRDDIFYQPQAGQGWIGSSTRAVKNFSVSGSNNLCFNADRTNCPASWNSGGGGMNADPLFTSNGTPTPNSAPGSTGGLIYVNADVKPKAGSPAIDAGYDTTKIAGRDIRGVKRPQGRAVDIGAYEVTPK